MLHVEKSETNTMSVSVKPPESDGGGSMTPSDASDGEERSERDSDYETDEEE